MQHPRWQEGKLSTGFIAEEFKGGFHGMPAEGERAQVIAAVAAAIDIVLGDRKRRISGQMIGREVTRERRRAVWLDKSEVALDVARERDGVVVRFLADDGKPGRARVLISAWKPGDPVWLGTLDGKVIAVQVRATLNGFVLSHHGVESKTFVYTEREAAAARLMPLKVQADSGKKLLCPMPGLVVSIAVVVGQEVKVGETLAVVEAMKMENVLRAEQDGIVKSIHAKKGDSLAVDAVILEFA
jgi:propionyl-CoA carboxylase alpha chain